MSHKMKAREGFNMNLIKMATAATVALGLGTGAALAEYPERPITLVVSFAAGGNADIGARLSRPRPSARSWACRSTS